MLAALNKRWRSDVMSPNKAVFLLVAALCLVETSFSSGRPNCSTVPSAFVTFARTQSVPLYAGRYAPYYYGAIVTLEDCSRWSVQVNQVYASQAEEAETEIMTFTYTANETGPFKVDILRVDLNGPNSSSISSEENADADPFKELRHRIAAQSQVPRWLTETVALPYYDAYVSPQASFMATRMNGSQILWPPVTTQDFAFVNLQTLRIVPLASGCWSIGERVPYLYALRYYWAFYAYAPFGVPRYVDANYAEFFGSEALDRAQAASVMMSAYCMPLSLILLRFALFVVKKALDVSDSHVYHYHKALTIADVIIAILVFIKETYLVAFIAVPFCLAWPHAFIPAIDSQEWLMNVKTVVNDLVETPLSLLVCFAYTIESMLALDRFAALYFPISYKRLMTAAKAKQFIFAAVILNSAALVAEISTTDGFRCMAWPDEYLCWTNQQYARGFSYGKLPRWLIVLSSCMVQVACCTAVFAKVLRRYRSQKNHGGSVSRRLVPFYLLLGTCGVGLLGLLFEVAMIVAEYASTFSPLPMIWRDITMALWALKLRFRTSLLSGCSSWSVVLHLLVSRHCREAAREVVSECAERLFKAIERFRVQAARHKPAVNPGISASVEVRALAANVSDTQEDRL